MSHEGPACLRSGGPRCGPDDGPRSIGRHARLAASHRGQLRVRGGVVCRPTVTQEVRSEGGATPLCEAGRDPGLAAPVRPVREVAPPSPLPTTTRQWSIIFGAQYARRLTRRQGPLGDTWFLDEVFVTINGQRQYLWRAVDQDGDVIDILVRPRRDGRAARRFFRKLLKRQRQEPSRLVTDKLGSYRVAHRDLMPLVTHDTNRYANNRAEVSHPRDNANVPLRVVG